MGEGRRNDVSAQPEDMPTGQDEQGEVPERRSGSTFDRSRHHRRTIRLRGYDYAQGGAYFVTIGTQNRAPLFGSVVDGEMILSDAGMMVASVWKSIPERFQYVALDEFVIMPDHMHGVVWIGVSEERESGGGDKRGGHEGRPYVAPDGMKMGGEDEMGGHEGRPYGAAEEKGGVGEGVGAPLVCAPKESGGGDEMGGHEGRPYGVPDGMKMAVGEKGVGAPLVGAPDERGGHEGRPYGAPEERRREEGPRPGLGDIIGAFKSLTTLAYGKGVRELGWQPFAGRLWHRNYYERIVRNEEALRRIREYIRGNPERWNRSARQDSVVRNGRR